MSKEKKGSYTVKTAGYEEQFNKIAAATRGLGRIRKEMIDTQKPGCIEITDQDGERVKRVCITEEFYKNDDSETDDSDD